MQHLDLFSGIGGFALAAQMVGGIQTTQFVEIDPYCQKVLRKNFPGVPIHDDITTFTADRGSFDLITGGFPCQDISSANPNGRGLEGERSGLFFELMRIVRSVRPRYLVLENVSEMLRKYNGRIMGTVLKELSESGYDAEWQTISAASVGAPHLRERVFIVATDRFSRRHDRGWASKAGSDGAQSNPKTKRSSSAVEAERLRQALSNTDSDGLESRVGWSSSCQTIGAIEGQGCLSGRANYWATESSVLRVANGVSNRVHRIRGLGNAVVPQVAAIALQRVFDLAALESAASG